MPRKAAPVLEEHGLAPEGVRSVERCIDILDLLVAQEREMTLSELATAIAAPKSTTLTVVRTLLRRGLVAYDARSRLYRVGLGFARFAKAQAEVDLRDIAIPHLRRLRIHTRLPVTIPSRLNAALLDWFCGTRLEPVMVLHANHARELSPALAAALLPFRRAGVTLLNQAVLLRGVNDTVSAQRELATQLHSHGVLPYYLHLLDRTDGTAHFEVSLRRARSLMKTLRGELPGYLVPRLVREIAGEPYKTPQS